MNGRLDHLDIKQLKIFLNISFSENIADMTEVRDEKLRAFSDPKLSRKKIFFLNIIRAKDVLNCFG